MRPLLFAAALLLPISSASAQQCTEFASRADFDVLSVAQVKSGQTRVPFLKPDCTATKPGACDAKAFVMPGDMVLVGQVFDTSACAAFVNAKGQVTEGLLPNARLEAPNPQPKSGAAAWVGTWTRIEAEIVIKPRGRDGQLSFAGNATYGAFDQQRVARGAVNLGEFSFDLKPARNSLDVSLKTNARGDTEPVARAKSNGREDDDTDCAVAMIALGPYLVVEDNRQCGGVNVSFTGLYRTGLYRRRG